MSDTRSVKMHKFVVYVKDFEGFDSNDIKSMLERSDAVFVKAFHVARTNIENWTDNHELNSTKTNEKQYDSYFGELI